MRDPPLTQLAGAGRVPPPGSVVRNSQPWWLLVGPEPRFELRRPWPDVARDDPHGRAAHFPAGPRSSTCARRHLRSAEPVSRLLPAPADPGRWLRCGWRRTARGPGNSISTRRWRRHAARSPDRGTHSSPLWPPWPRPPRWKAPRCSRAIRGGARRPAAAPRTGCGPAGAGRVLLLAPSTAPSPARSRGRGHRAPRTGAQPRRPVPAARPHVGHGPPGPATPRRPLTGVMRIAAALMT